MFDSNKDAYCELDFLSAKKPIGKLDMTSPEEGKLSKGLSSARKKIDFSNDPQCSSFYIPNHLKNPSEGFITMRYRLSILPRDVKYLVLSFLEDREIIFCMQFVDSCFRRSIEDPVFWKYIASVRPALKEVHLKYCKIDLISSTKSKGDSVKVRDRITQEVFLMKVVDVEIANGGFHNGIPTSVLREVSTLNSLMISSNVNR